MTANLHGLSKGEVEALVLEGKSNFYDAKPTRTIWDIIRSNMFNLFIVLNFLIAFALIAVGSYTNAIFIVFVSVGVASGIIVEIRARSLVKNLTLLNTEKVVVVRDGAEEKVDPAEIVLGDLLKLSTGDQVPSDSAIVEGRCEVNEALLTGESDLIDKHRGSHLLSGSFITSGICYATVEHVAAENYVTKLAIEAKSHKPINSEIAKSIQSVAKFTSWVILPLGAILLLEALFVNDATLQSSVITTSAALIGMLPKGLAVLTVIALITAVYKLARRKVLVQEIYSVETMAHVDTLCLDKTGTLTEGKMRVRGFCSLSERYTEEQIEDILGSYLQNGVDNNATMLAFGARFAKNEIYKASSITAFSSDRKWSSMYLDGIGMVVLGAPERIFETTPAEVEKRQSRGLRVLGLGITDKKSISGKGHLKGVVPIAMIELDDGIRKDAKKTLRYLREQGIDLKVISGDNPVTVSKIAERAGFTNFDNYIDTSEMSDDSLRTICAETAIFGRVAPRQKKLIVAELKRLGRTVAMTGDGVNDILALREADLSIVMAEGDSATKQISNIVLLESNFSEVPEVLFEGRRVVNNMTRVGSIFFVKTIYSFFLSIICALSVFFFDHAVVFPFIAIQITVIDQILEGYPTFFMSFEADKTKVSDTFLRTSLLRALPQAIMVTVALSVLYVVTSVENWPALETSALMYHALGVIMIIAVFKACQPFKPLRLFLFTTSAIGFFLSAFILGQWFSDFIHFGTLSIRAAGLLAITTLICVALRAAFSYLQKHGKRHGRGHKGKRLI